MENDILRVENFKNAKTNVNSSHFKNNSETHSNKNTKTSIPSLIRDERRKNYSNNKEESIFLAPKPKILSSIILAISLLLADTIIAFLCFVTKEITFAITCATVCSLTLPIAISLFFYKLDTRSNFSLLTIYKMFACGALAFFIVEIAYSRLTDVAYNLNNLILLLRSVIDITLMLIITALFYKNSKKTGAITLMLIACVVASGFSTFKSLLTSFDSLFIKVQIFDGQSLSVGAIINTGEWANRSISLLLKNIINNCFYQPLIFTSLCIIIGYSLNYHFNKIARISQNRTSNLLIIITCFLIYALISFDTSILFFEIIYNVCAVLFTACMLYDVLDYSIKNEKYKQGE